MSQIKSRFFLIPLFLFCPIVLLGQQFDLTGRVSLRTQNISYDEDSDIRPDSVTASEYGKGSLVPGWQQLLNVSLFGRTSDLDMTLLADLKNSEWNRFSFQDFRSVSRFTLDLRSTRHHLVIGDFFESYGETFMQSREVRGGKYELNLENTFGKNSFLDVRALGGIVQKAVGQGDRLQDLYKQYETSGQYRRILGVGDLRFGKRGVFDLSLNYLWGKDQESSIDTSINAALANQLIGGQGNLYFWDRNVRLFGEYYQSRLDTMSFSESTDNSYNAGVDLRYNTAKLILMYQRIGYRYYTAGYPFLENDKVGLKGQLAYLIPETVSLFADFELYDDNLDDLATVPTTSTTIIDIGATTFIPDWPEFTLKYGLRTDGSDTKTIEVEEQQTSIKTDKKTTRYEAGLAYRFNHTRMSLSAIYLDLNDKSLLSSGDPLGTEQFIGSFNIYTTGIKNFFLSGGAVYSTLNMTDNRKNTNFFIYESNRWDLLPRKLKLETNLTYIVNDAENGGIPDVLSDYTQISGEISLEYFFNNQLSFKLIVGTDVRKFKYSTEEALSIIAMDEYGPTYFNLNESYSGLIMGGEFNWIF